MTKTMKAAKTTARTKRATRTVPVDPVSRVAARHAGYTVKSFKQCMSRDGVAFSGVLCHKGVRIGEFYNDGNGGETTVHIKADSDRAAFRRAALAQYPSYSQYSAPPVFMEDILAADDDAKMVRKLVARGYTYFYRVDYTPIGDGIFLGRQYIGSRTPLPVAEVVKTACVRGPHRVVAL